MLYIRLGERKHILFIPSFHTKLSIIDYQKLAAKLWKIMTCLKGKDCVCRFLRFSIYFSN